MDESDTFRGRIALWYHPICFWQWEYRPKTVEEFSQFDSLRLKDQEKIRKMMETSLAANDPGSAAKFIKKVANKNEHGHFVAGDVKTIQEAEMVNSGGRYSHFLLSQTSTP